MQRLVDIYNRLLELGKKIDTSYPKYKKDDDIKMEYSDIKNDIKKLQSILRKKVNKNEATREEEYIIEPALHQAYVSDLRARIGCNVGQSMADSVYSAQSTIMHYLPEKLK